MPENPENLPVALDIPKDDIYDLQFVPILSAEDNEHLAELDNTLGWKVLLRIITAEIRAHEIFLADTNLTSAQQVAILARWNAVRHLYKAIRYAPMRAKKDLAALSEQERSHDNVAGAKMPLVFPKNIQ